MFEVKNKNVECLGVIKFPHFYGTDFFTLVFLPYSGNVNRLVIFTLKR